MSIIEGIIRGILSIFLLLIAVIFLGGLYNGLTSNHDTDVISQNSKDGERSGESESASDIVESTNSEKEAADLEKDRKISESSALIERNFKIWMELSTIGGKCEAQDPDNVKDVSACNRANQILTNLSRKGICVSQNFVDWSLCRPNSKIDRVYPGRNMTFISTKATQFGPSEKLVDIMGMLASSCHGVIEESDFSAFAFVKDPYSIKDRCFAMTIPTYGKLQWFDEFTLGIFPPAPDARVIVVTSKIHPELGKRAVFKGASPVRYHDALGMPHMATTFDLSLLLN